MMEYAEHKDGTIKVYAPHGPHVGDILMGEDGYYEFWPNLSRDGFWPSWLLRNIADKVDSLNDAWDAKVKEGVGYTGTASFVKRKGDNNASIS